MGNDLGGSRSMLPTPARLCRPHLDRTDALGPDGDRLPLHIAGPIVVALSLSLWGCIGLIVSTLL